MQFLILMWLFVYWKTEFESKITHSVIKKDGLNFVRLYFLNYIRYVMIYIKFQRECPKFLNIIARVLT